MIEVKLSFTNYEDALEAMTKLAGKAVIQEIKPTHEHVKPKAVKKQESVVETPAPVVEVKPAPVVEEPPAPPVFVPPVPEPAVDVVTGIPFNDQKGMIGYVMDSYKALGAQKGAGIQTVLQALGYNNINDVDPKDYEKLYQGIEQLKG